jgi:hypothetical protein
MEKQSETRLKAGWQDFVRSRIPTFNRIAEYLRRSKKVKAEVRKEGCWFRDFDVPGYLRFCIQFDGHVLEAGWYDEINGDAVKEMQFKFKVSVTGALTPYQYEADMPSRLFVLDKEKHKGWHFDKGEIEIGAEAAAEYGVFDLLKDMDNAIANLYEVNILRG